MATKFFVDWEPVAQPRQRHRIVGEGASAWIQNYTPKSHPVTAFKTAVVVRAKYAHNGAPYEGPLILTVEFFMPRPQRLVWKKRPMPRIPHDCKPDADNLLKSLKDALRGITWIDDCQVAVVHAHKFYAGGGEQSGVSVLIEEWPDGGDVSVPVREVRSAGSSPGLEQEMLYAGLSTTAASSAKASKGRRGLDD